MATTYAIQPIKVGYLDGLSAIPQDEGIEAAGQSWKAGAVLKNSSGSVAIASADDVAGLLGIALSAATGTTGAKCTWVKALPNVIFEGTLEDETNLNHALVQGNLFGQFAIQVTAGGIFYLDENDSTNDATIVVRLDPEIGAIGDIRARVFFQFLFSKTVYGAS